MFKEMLKKVREEKGITQQELAKLLIIKNYTISDYEQGRSEPDLETLKKICIILDISADELLEIDTEKKKQTFINSFNGNFKNTNIKF